MDSVFIAGTLRHWILFLFVDTYGGGVVPTETPFHTAVAAVPSVPMAIPSVDITRWCVKQREHTLFLS